MKNLYVHSAYTSFTKERIEKNNNKKITKRLRATEFIGWMLAIFIYIYI